MPLTLATGPANAGKTGVVFDALEDAIAAGRPAALLLPAAPDVRRTRPEVARRCPVGVEVAQIDRFLAARWALWGDGRRLVSRVGRAILLEEALRHAGEDVRATGAGLARALEVVVRQAIDPVALTEACDSYVRIILTYGELLEKAQLIEPAKAQALLAASEPPGQACLVAHRFTDLSVAHERYLIERAERGADVLVTFTWEEGFPGTRALDALVTRLLAAGARHRRLEPDRPYYRSPDLAGLGAGLFRTTEAKPPEGGVRMIETRGPEEEVRAVVASATKLIGEGVPPEQIAIVHREPARVLERLSGVLEEAGLGADLDAPIPARATGLGRALLRLLAFTEQSERADLVAFLRTPYAGIEPGETDRLERTWRRWRAEGRGRLMAELAEASPDAARTLRAAERAQGAQDPREAAQAWRRALDGMLVAACGGDAPVLTGTRTQDADVHRTVCEILDEFRVEKPARADDIRRAFSQLRIQPSGVERSGRLQVMGARRARSRRFRAVVLFGLDGETFPRAGGEGLAADAVASLARRLGVRPSAEDGLDGERLLFYQVLTRASERLVLVRQAFDDAGDARRASTFWHEVTDVLGTDLIETHDRGTQPASPHEERLRVRRRSGRVPRALGDATVLAELAGRDAFSASELEAYLGCPYRWFFQRVVRPDELDGELSALEFGGLAHRALEAVYRDLEERTGVRRVTPGTVDAALGLADEALAEARERLPAPSGLAEVEGVRRARERVRDLLRADARSFDGFEPVGLEWSFGMEDEAEDFGAFRLRGRVDRIDRRDDDLVVMDYKWGSAASHGHFADCGLVQLPLYAEVVRRRFGGTIVGGLYRALGAQEDRGFVERGKVASAWLKPRSHDWVEPGGVEALVACALERARQAVEGIRAGDVAARPIRPETCRYCGASATCGGDAS